MSGRYRRLVDLVELTGLLQTTTTGLSIDQIAERFAVSRRTAERMLEALRERFPKLEPQIRGGRKYWMLRSGDQGRPLQLPGELEQLSRRVVELEARAEQHAIADQVLGHSAVGIFLLDSKFQVVWVNAALEQLFDISADDVIGRDTRQLIDEMICDKFEHCEEFRRRVCAAYDDNTYVEHFRCHMLPLGDRPGRWLEHWSQPVEIGPYAGGRLEHYIEVAPLTRRGALGEPELSTPRFPLPTVDVGESASDLLRAPLAHLIETARQGLEGPRNASDALEEIRDVAGHLEDHISHTLRSVVSGELRVEHVEAGSVLREVADQIRFSAERAGISVSVGGADEPIRFMAEPSLLVHALVDIGRAELARLGRGGALELVASRDDALDCVILAMRVRPGEADTGPGDVAVRDTDPEGVGSARALARAVAREIVSRHGGDVSVIRERDGIAPTYSLQLPRDQKR